MRKHLQVGTNVRVRFIEDDKIPNIGAKKYNKCETWISKKTEFGAHGVMYELDGCVSDLGVPYTFTADELVLIEESE